MLKRLSIAHLFRPARGRPTNPARRPILLAAVFGLLLSIAGAAPATDIPAAGYFNDVITNQNAKDAQDQVLAVLRETLGGQAASTLTIAGGNATPTRALHAIDTEAAASTDNLDQLVVTNMPDGRVIAIRPADNSRAVVVRHAQGGSGQILLASGTSLTLNDTTMWLLLERRGTDWREISRFYGANLSAFRTFYGVLPSAGGSLTGALNEAKAADVASAASPDIWAGAGNLVHITGTTTITGFAAAPQAGAARVLIFDGALTLTAGANLKLNGGGSNVVTAAGDIALVVANTTTSFYAYVIKASGQAQVGGMPRSYLAGLAIANNATDANNDIDVAVGAARSDDNTTDLVLAATLIKRLDAGWSVGTNQGGLDTGAKANSTWYHVWLIERPDTGVVDALFSTSATSPTMPANYTKKRRLGAVKTDGSGNILAFKQRGDVFLWSAAVLDVNEAANPGTAAVDRTLTVPPGIVVTARINVSIVRGGSGTAFYISSKDQSDQTPAITGTPLSTILGQVGNSGDRYWGGVIVVETDTSAIVRTRFSASDGTVKLSIATLSWIDRRGRDD